MITVITVIALTLFTNLSMAHEYTQGSFTGGGSWKTETARGSYQAVTKIEKTHITANYKFENNKEYDFSFELKEKTNGLFDVISSRVKIGTGYCLEKARVCHYDVEIEGLKLEESIVQVANKLYRFGSKIEGTRTTKTVWAEALVLEK